MEKVLITGGLGQLGYFIYEELKTSYDIMIIDNHSTSKISPPKDVLFIEGDINKTKIFDQLSNIDFIIHAAAQVSVNKSTQKPVFDANNNIMGTLNLLEYARKKDISMFINICSAATYGDPEFLPVTETHPRNPLSPYGLSKLVAEKYCLLYNNLYGLNTCSLILFNLYSKLQKEDDPYAGVIYKFMQRVKKGLPPKIEGDGLQTRDFIHAKDVAKAVKLCMKSKLACGKKYNIGSGKPTTILRLAEIIIEISGKNLEPIHTKPRIGDIRESYCSIAKARKELGFNPEISLREGLNEVYKTIKIK